MAGTPDANAVILKMPSESKADNRGQNGMEAAATNDRRFRLGHRPALDGLRAIAVLVVIIFHLNSNALPGGYLGVDIFFVLSGFLITSLLLEEWQSTGSLNVGRFYWRRVVRLMPALLLVVGACWTYAYAFSPIEEQETLVHAGKMVLAFQTDWFFANAMDFLTYFAHTWSLSVEGQFYLIWPLVLGFMLWRKAGPRAMALTMLLGILSCNLYRTLQIDPEATNVFPRLYPKLELRGDSFLTGALVAVLAGYNLLPQTVRFRTWLRGTAQAAAVMIAILIYDGPSWQTQMYPMFHGMFLVVAALVGVLLLALLYEPSHLVSEILESTFLTWIGKLSYGLYLWHFPMLMLLPATTLKVPAPLVWKVQIVATFAVAAASYYAIERPLLSWRRKALAVSAPVREVQEAGKLAA